ncbi:MAG TPA: dipeptidase [Bryobacteraceae bacterium]|jgi:acetylornithine deacetylase/succinyl-diaminopimelate desuccinylase-like protein
MREALAYARRYRARFVDELKSFVRFPSVSAEPAHRNDVRACAEWLAKHLRAIGMPRVALLETKGAPVVFAASRQRPGRQTLLIYGHYDVVPAAGAATAWRTPPFDPQIRGSNLYGRGVCDDKGQMFIHVKALESYLRNGGPPVNVKCIFEGEEEVGSPHLSSFIRRHARALRANAAVISDTKMLGPGRPAISYSQRGVLGVEIEVSGPDAELHAGNFGGAIHNPAQVLCEIVAGLHDSRGRCIIPGFYDSVRKWSTSERSYMRRTGPRDEEIVSQAQRGGAWGERGFSQYERTTIRPAVTINGITSGHQGTGVKAVIPPRAVAKIGLRLVPDQDPAEIAGLLREHIARVTPPTVRAAVRVLSQARPALVDRNEPAMHAATLAYEKGFGARPIFIRSGGTIPVVDMFRRELGIPTVLMGFALPSDRIHAANEKFHLPDFFKGIETSTRFMAALA